MSPTKPIVSLPGLSWKKQIHTWSNSWTWRKNFLKECFQGFLSFPSVSLMWKEKPPSCGSKQFNFGNKDEHTDRQESRALKPAVAGHPCCLKKIFPIVPIVSKETQPPVLILLEHDLRECAEDVRGRDVALRCRPPAAAQMPSQGQGVFKASFTESLCPGTSSVSQPFLVATYPGTVSPWRSEGYSLLPFSEVL